MVASDNKQKLRRVGDSSPGQAAPAAARAPRGKLVFYHAGRYEALDLHLIDLPGKQHNPGR
jgi:hypothetical protein